MAWDLRGKPMARLENPVTAFHRLFSNETTPLSERQAMLAQKRSVLDAVLEDAKRVQNGLTKTDTDKLDECRTTTTPTTTPGAFVRCCRGVCMSFA